MKYLVFLLMYTAAGFPFQKEPTDILSKEKKESVFSPTSLHAQLMDSTLCNGFDQPLGTGWKIFVQAGEKPMGPGETWKYQGKISTGQPLYSVAAGKVLFAGPVPTGNIVLIEHRFAENGQLITVYSRYVFAGKIKVNAGETIGRKQEIGTIETIPHLHLEIRKENMKNQAADFTLSENEKTDEWIGAHYEKVSAFIRAHKKTIVPFKKNKLLLVDKTSYQCYLYQNGHLERTYEIALGQVPVGPKEKQGDLKVPEGEYQICEKTKGPFSTKNNWSAAYLGTRWMCLTYPNVFDAQKALDTKRITREQFNRIEQASRVGIRPPQNTALGGAVGLHGWIESDWSNDSDRAQTWGCVSFHNSDLNELYELVDIKTTVIIIP